MQICMYLTFQFYYFDDIILIAKFIFQPFIFIKTAKDSTYKIFAKS